VHPGDPDKAARDGFVARGFGLSVVRCGSASWRRASVARPLSGDWRDVMEMSRYPHRHLSSSPNDIPMKSCMQRAAVGKRRAAR